MYLSPPSSSSPAPKPRPTLTLIHGGPNTRLAPSFTPFYYHWAHSLLRHNYGVLIPNYRGSSGRGGAFATWSHKHPTTYAYADVLACTQAAVDAGLADRCRLAIGGYSHGGMLTLWGAVKNGLQTQVSEKYDWQWRATIAGASIADSDSMALTSDLGAVYQPELQEGRVVWNMDVGDARNRRASPLWHFKEAVDRGQRDLGEDGNDAGASIPPLLLLHGAEDKRCHVSQAVGMRRAMESAGLPFEMVIYPRQGHFFHEQKAWVDTAKRVRQWCDLHL